MEENLYYLGNDGRKVILNLRKLNLSKKFPTNGGNFDIDDIKPIVADTYVDNQVPEFIDDILKNADWGEGILNVYSRTTNSLCGFIKWSPNSLQFTEYDYGYTTRSKFENGYIDNIYLPTGIKLAGVILPALDNPRIIYDEYFKSHDELTSLISGIYNLPNQENLSNKEILEYHSKIISGLLTLARRDIDSAYAVVDNLKNVTNSAFFKDAKEVLSCQAHIMGDYINLNKDYPNIEIAKAMGADYAGAQVSARINKSKESLIENFDKLDKIDDIMNDKGCELIKSCRSFHDSLTRVLDVEVGNK